MNKTTIKIFLSFSFVSAIIATMLLVMNALGIGILITDTGIITPKHSPTSVLEDISLNLEKTDTGYTLANTNIPSEYWCILLNDDGNIVWSQNKPDDIPTHYSIRDIAKLTHWFLCDYPVFVRTENCGLLILGIPKNAVGKYELIYSMKWFDKMWNYTVELFTSMDIPVRTLECCSGDLADLKVKSLDVEAWSPRQQKYFEVGSCSNLGDAQARRLGIKVKSPDGNYYAHTLNNTVSAPPRMLIALIENNLNEDGSVNIPKVLQPYMGGKAKIEIK